MTITLDRAGKRFRKEWIFRDVTLSISAGERVAILGGNGSGKSTFLRVAAGFISPSAGRLSWKHDDKDIDAEELWRHVSLASPYLQLPDDLTVRETVMHVSGSKPFMAGITTASFLETATLSQYGDKRVRELSSGLRQRLKLALAILCDTPLLLLDEPVSNLDKPAIAWYREMIGKFAGNRTIIVCSNEISAEYSFCSYSLTLPSLAKGAVVRESVFP